MKRYRIISELGKGATGVVYKAVRAEDSATVALKKLVLPGHLDSLQEEDFIKRFKSEAKAALELKHPGIVGALDCGLDEGTLYIAYELVDGVTIEEAIRAGRKFHPEEIADIIAQCAEALEFAHLSGVVHRDLSPGNIFLTRDGKAKITDFGVAGFTSRTTVTPGDQSIVGTPGYMAPEQITGSEADPRSDIFSLGCVAYELLAGKPAFTGDNLAQIIHRVINEQPKAIRESNPSVPLALEELVFRMLAKNPDYRYQSMGDVQVAAMRALEAIPRAKKTADTVQSGHAPMLVAVEGPHKGEEFNLMSSVTTIGRTIGDILLAKDPGVATQHAWITKEETGWVLYDADTEGGTLLNGEEIEREEVLPGDRIKLGDTVLEFRGAGGHVGAFKEQAEAGAPAKKAQPVQISKRTQWLPVMFLAIPGIILLVGLIVLGIILPRQYIARLDAVTVERWDSAFEVLDTTAIGDQGWVDDASDILASWGAVRIFHAATKADEETDIETETNTETEEPVESEPESESDSGIKAYMAPSWVIGSSRINNQVLYRLDLFGMAEEFLGAVTARTWGTASGEPALIQVNPALQTIRQIESRLLVMETPAGIDPTWVGRKNQLLSIVRRWLGASPAAAGGADSRGNTAERELAEQKLLDGWFTYQEAAGRFDMLDTAYRDLQSSVDTLSQILAAEPEDEGAAAVRGLAFFLQAKILRDAGENERIQRALNTLDFAEADVGMVQRDVWADAIPEELQQEFRSPTSLMSQIRALRASLSGQITDGQ